MGKQDRSTGGGGEELSKLESILEELIEIGEDTDQRVEEFKKQQQGKSFLHAVLNIFQICTSKPHVCMCLYVVDCETTPLINIFPRLN